MHTLTIPDALMHELAIVAMRRHTTVLKLVHSFFKLGLLASAIEDDPDADLLIRQGEQVERLVVSAPSDGEAP